MRKMTKMAVTLAAMSAMTVAAASMVSANTDTFTSIGGDVVAEGTGTGEWGGDDVDGWSFTAEDGTKLKNGWNQIDGVWYYFKKDGVMAQNELIYVQGETYFLNPDGSMMANGWVGFDRESDILYDYDLDITENEDDINNPVFKDAADAYETVWMYFDSNGTAMDDEWMQAADGLWYCFDDIVMVCGDYDHEVNGSYYGFGEDGHMFVGWEQNVENAHIQAPNKTEDTWYYYNPIGGKKFDVADNDDLGYGWKKIDGKWYCFKSQEEDEFISVGTLITNAYFSNKVTGTGNSDYYYVDKNGVMATGVVTVNKEALYVTPDTDSVSGYSWADGHKVKDDLTGNGGDSEDVLFDSDGKAKADAWDGNRYYAKMGAEATNVKNFDKDTYAVTAYASKGDKLKGALVKNAFISKSDHMYYVDKYGDKVTNSAVQVGENTNYKEFILFNAKGEAYEDVDAGRTVKIGSKKYTAIGNYTDGPRTVTLFQYENKN